MLQLRFRVDNLRSLTHHALHSAECVPRSLSHYSASSMGTSNASLSTKVGHSISNSHWWQQSRARSLVRTSASFSSLNSELIIGDAVVLIIFAFWKQISAIILSPDFPGWLAPLDLDPVRFAEFIGFTCTLVGTWACASFLIGCYSYSTGPSLTDTARKAVINWLVAMPVSACQLVIATAMESSALVGDEGFASKLPLAASGPGEPFVTWAGVLGCMTIWRCYYSLYFDIWNPSSLKELQQESETFQNGVNMMICMATVAYIVLQVLKAVIPPDSLESMSAFINWVT